MNQFDSTIEHSRKLLPHNVPAWVDSGAIYFITICTCPRGINQLCYSALADRIWASVLHRQEIKQWLIHLFLLMPDHLHALMSFSHDPGMKISIASWKRYLSRREHISWQRDFFDHRLRTNENLIAKANYIRENPVRSGLIKTGKTWLYIWPK